MPSQSEVKWSQLKVGIVVMVSLSLLIALLFFMTSAQGLGLFSRKLTLYTYFENAAGVKEGAAVNLQGVTIGTVKSVNVVHDPKRKLTPIQVVMRIDGKFQPDLHLDTRASLSTVGVLGDTVIDLNSQTANGPMVEDHAELKTLETPNLQDVVKSSQGTIESLNVILAKLDRIVDKIASGQGSVGGLIYDDTLYKRANATIEELHTLEVNLNNGKGSVGKLLHDDDVYNNLDQATAKLNRIVDDLAAGKGSAGKLLHDDALYNNLNSTLAHANSLLAEADQGKGALGLLAKDPAFAGKLNDTVTNLNSLLSGINKGEGTAGLLVKDPALYHNLDKLAVDSQMLVNTIRSDPKKYLTIHFKVF
ncbi:MlaD family protein [Terriglobus sp. RCC_193]|uniref:MlaD family protein n=1 Tax=Terriglobus sp. RCC_193 TaxID=3239218 RepID=UPI003524436F